MSSSGHAETDGLYRVICHPRYLGLLLGLFGWALVFRSAIGLSREAGCGDV
jgi:protein-S-isoprenylcysteine O-methyltransferase Ste14